jgi:hypothetical protein
VNTKGFIEASLEIEGTPIKVKKGDRKEAIMEEGVKTGANQKIA